MEEQSGLLEQSALLQVQTQVAIGFLGFLKVLDGGCGSAATQQFTTLALLQQLAIPDDVVQSCAVQADPQQVAVAQISAVQVGMA
ncbi:hypothetical protein D9M68_786550 [compost metagenome]